MSRPLAAAITVGVETDINDAIPVLAKLHQLAVVEMRSQRPNGMVEAGLPQGREVE